MPVKDGVCLTSTSYIVQVCLPDPVIPADAGVDALRGFQSVICSRYMDPSSLVLFGLLADGVQNLQFVRADGSTVAVPVANNFAYFSLTKGETQPVSATWQDANGTSYSGTLPLPSDAGTSVCGTSQTQSDATRAAKKLAAVSAR